MKKEIEFFNFSAKYRTILSNEEYYRIFCPESILLYNKNSLHYNVLFGIVKDNCLVGTNLSNSIDFSCGDWFTNDDNIEDIANKFWQTSFEHFITYPEASKQINLNFHAGIVPLNDQDIDFEKLLYPLTMANIDINSYKILSHINFEFGNNNFVKNIHNYVIQHYKSSGNVQDYILHCKNFERDTNLISEHLIELFNEELTKKEFKHLAEHIIYYINNNNYNLAFQYLKHYKEHITVLVKYIKHYGHFCGYYYSKFDYSGFKSYIKTNYNDKDVISLC